MFNVLPLEDATERCRGVLRQRLDLTQRRVDPYSCWVDAGSTPGVDTIQQSFLSTEKPERLVQESGALCRGRLQGHLLKQVANRQWSKNEAH